MVLARARVEHMLRGPSVTHNVRRGVPATLMKNVPAKVDTMNLDHNTAQRIVDQLQKGIHGEIWVVDLKNHLLAGTTPTGYHLAGSAINQKQTTADGAVDECCVNLPLRADYQEVGRLIIAETTAITVEAAHMAKTLAEFIIHQQIVFAKTFDRYWVVDKFISDLLHGQLSPDDERVREEALLMEIDLGVPRIAAVINTSPLTEHEGSTPNSNGQPFNQSDRSSRQRRRRFAEQAQKLLGNNPSHIYSTFDPHRFVILIAIDTDQAEHEVHKAKHEVQRVIDEIGPQNDTILSAGIGAYYPGWQALAQSYQDACFALETGQILFSFGRVYTVPDLGLPAFVCTNDTVMKSHLACHLLRPLLEKPELLHTLEVFLDAGLSAGIAARRLYMHRHGLTYRLKKIHELTGLDPTSFRDASQLDAALQWYSVTIAGRQLFHSSVKSRTATPA